MALHDWIRVDAGIFHDFHNVWLGGLRNLLNDGILPSGYYALTERHAGRYIADVLTLHAGPQPALPPPRPRSRRKTLAIRHVSGHRLVAMLEVVSPSNKDRREHVEEFLDKMEDALRHGVHLLVLDLFPPGSFDPQGMHGAL